MKTFSIFKEDLKKSLSPLKDFGKSFAGQAEKFAKSDDANFCIICLKVCFSIIFSPVIFLQLKLLA